MLFHSQVFLLAFLPLTLAGYYALAHSRRARQWLLILASFVSCTDISVQPQHLDCGWLAPVAPLP